jgi:thiol:disulfide interchange protein DsbD
MIWTLLGIFVGGIALNLTPCVYPLIPITVSYFGSRSGQGQGACTFTPGAILAVYPSPIQY